MSGERTWFRIVLSEYALCNTNLNGINSQDVSGLTRTGMS